MPNIDDSARATDGFGVVSTPVVVPDVTRPIEPAHPVRKRPSGRMDFPSGVTLLPPESLDNHPIHMEGLGFITRGVAESLAASLAGAVRALAEREAREAATKEREQS